MIEDLARFIYNNFHWPSINEKGYFFLSMYCFFSKDGGIVWNMSRTIVNDSFRDNTPGAIIEFFAIK